MFASSQLGSTILFFITIGASLLGLYATPTLIEKSLFRPYWFLRKKEYDTLYMSGFLHADLGHLIFNMLTFYFFAFPLEHFLGTVPFLMLYVAGLTLSESCTYFKHRNDPNYATLGASGAISAVLFSYIVYFPTTSLFIIPIPFPIPAWLFAIAYMAYTYYSARQSSGRVNHDAHLCGALTGLGFVLLTDPQAYTSLINRF